MWVMLDHTQSAIAGLSLTLKFGVNVIYSLEILRFYILPFWLHIAYSRPFVRSFGGIFPPDMVTHRSNPLSDHPCADTRRLSHKG